MEKKGKSLTLVEVEDEINLGFRLSKLVSITLNDAVGDFLFISFRSNTLR